MLCSLCDLDMRITQARHELTADNPPAVELVQTLVCPKCHRTVQVRHGIELAGQHK
jgi:Zn finger protein HypA/HybF involved in hydrogenase expression